MNGAESLVATLLASDVDVCFSNPGTSEMHFVAALDQAHGMRCVLALFEGVATGAADGYWRIAGKPASTLLHLGPGLANGIANLHNAKKAGSGVVNIVGEHATGHIALDAPLTADIEGLARPVSHWVHTSMRAEDVAQAGAEAVAAAKTAPGQVATLILPGDTAWNEAAGPAAPIAASARPAVPADRIEAAARALSGPDSLLLLGGAALTEESLASAAKIAAKTGCGLLTEWSNARLARGAGRIAVNRIPYVVEQATALLAPYKRIVLMGADRPIAFFAYPDKPGVLTAEGTEFTEVATAADDIGAALADLVAATDAAAAPVAVEEAAVPDLPGGEITLDGLACVIANAIPENAIVADESITTGRQFFPFTKGAAPHDWLNNRGGSIGYSLPVAIGAAIAAPDRKVLAMVGDGSAMYTPQALWTMAREGLDITVVVWANRTYRILQGELTNVGVQNPGPRAVDMLTLGRPELNFVEMAKGMGVPGVRVDDLGAFHKALTDGLASDGPALIEVMM